jgi:hypothetical protein
LFTTHAYLQFDKHNEGLGVTFPSRFRALKERGKCLYVCRRTEGKQNDSFSRAGASFKAPRAGGDAQIFPCSGKENYRLAERTRSSRRQSYATMEKIVGERERNAKTRVKSSVRRYCLRRIYSSYSNSRLHFLHMFTPSAEAV